MYKRQADDSLLKKYYDIKAEQGTLLDVSGYVGTKYPADATQEEINAFYAEHKNEVECQIPVSYTHLDVYKRQLVDLLLEAPAPAGHPTAVV